MLRIYVIAFVAACLLAFGGGWYVNGLRWSDRVAEQELVAVELADKLAKAKENYKSERDKRLGLVEQNGVLQSALDNAEAAVVVKEVVKYVQSDSAGDCELPDAWVRIHNRAAGVPAVSDAAAVADAATGKVRTDSDALPVITANYGRCQACRTRLEALQGWLGSIEPVGAE